MEVFVHLALALAVGLLIGVERGWSQRTLPEGGRIAGIRTFGLIGLLGGLWALLGEELGQLILAVAFAALAGLLIMAYARFTKGESDYGVTTVVAALVTFALGALALRGYEHVAAAGAVVTATLLSLKPILHGWLLRIEQRELYGALKLLLISVVLLPVLPNRGFGPWQALNPYELWWLVVLIAGIGFAGYVAIRVAGARRGLLLTGLLGGLVSSTALTLSFARMGRSKILPGILSAGVLAAAAIMFPRILLEVAVVNRQLLPQLYLPMGVMTATVFGSAVWFWLRGKQDVTPDTPPLHNPFELKPALQFGVLLAAIVLLAEAFRVWFGDAGIYALAAISGLTDVDAITLSLARMARVDLTHEVAVRGIVLAAMVNTLAKGVLVAAIAGRGMGLRVLPVVMVTLALGGATLLL